MQPRTLEQILSEYNATYQPSIDYLRQRQAQAPQMVEADIAAANAAQTKAYEDILTGARRRGLGFSGIPLGEQAQYASNVYAPAILAARQKGTEYGQNLESTILGLQAEARSQALARRNAEQDMATQLAAARTSGGGGGSTDTSVLDWLKNKLGGGDQEQPKAFTQQREDKGYDFTDAAGNPISAAKYAQLTGMSIGQVLYQMGKSGDVYSQNLYNQLKNDPFFGKGNASYDAKIKQTYRPIFWGT